MPIALDDGDDIACSCATADGAGHLLYAGQRCFVRSRGRECLYSGDDFPGCVPDGGVSDGCSEVCNELSDRVARDAARTFDATVRSFRCHGRGDCAVVVEIDGRCYVSGSTERHDCSLSDEEIIAAEVEAVGYLQSGSFHTSY